MDNLTAGVLVIGGGPGGYVAAIRAGQLGLKTVLVEELKLGGTCLNVGCIPSKALIHVATAFETAQSRVASSPFGLTTGAAELDFRRSIGWKDGIVERLNNGVAGLLKKSGVRVLHGRATIEDGKSCIVATASGEIRLRAEHLVLATGSTPTELTAVPFGGNVVSSTGALSMTMVPRRLVVVGAGYIGLELGTAFAKLGSTVTVVEVADRILPSWDVELTRPIAKQLKKLDVMVLTASLVLGLSPDKSALIVKAASGATSEHPAETVLVAAGRSPCTAGFGLEKLDLTMHGACIAIDDRCATSMRNVWAIGDVTGEPMLAHRAMAQGRLVAEIISGGRRVFDARAIPAVCFTDPEIVAVGLLPEAASVVAGAIKTGKFSFNANGRAMTQHDEAGFIRIVARADNDLVLGVQAVGAGVAELATAFSLAIEMGATLEDIAATVHGHPTRGEALHEAALSALGHGLHI